jgi:hypothetical protein
VDGIKKLSYVKMNSILWGAVREQQQKIEWLESSVYELIDEIKELKGKKKPKAKAKPKAENNNNIGLNIWAHQNLRLRIVVLNN